MDTEMHDDNAAESEEDDDAQDDDDDDADMNRESVGFALNQRLLQAAALRERGVEDVIMDPEWEQFLKEAQERGDLSIEGTREALRIMASELARRDQLVQIARGQAVSSGQSQSPAAPA
jgi:hypothetical protein